MEYLKRLGLVRAVTFDIFDKQKYDYLVKIHQKNIKNRNISKKMQIYVLTNGA